MASFAGSQTRLIASMITVATNTQVERVDDRDRREDAPRGARRRRSASSAGRGGRRHSRRAARGRRRAARGGTARRRSRSSASAYVSGASALAIAVSASSPSQSPRLDRPSPIHSRRNDLIGKHAARSVRQREPRPPRQPNRDRFRPPSLARDTSRGGPERRRVGTRVTSRPPGSRTVVRRSPSWRFFGGASSSRSYFLAVAFLAVFLAADFLRRLLGRALLRRRALGPLVGQQLGGPLKVMVSTSSPLRSVALNSPSVTYGPNRPSLTTTGCSEAGSARAPATVRRARRPPRCFGSA